MQPASEKKYAGLQSVFVKLYRFLNFGSIVCTGRKFTVVSLVVQIAGTVAWAVFGLIFLLQTDNQMYISQSTVPSHWVLLDRSYKISAAEYQQSLEELQNENVGLF